MNKTQKGFTLLELLIVIAILAVLATVAVLVINPAEYLRQARDSQRIGDLAALKGATDLILTSATSTNPLGSCPSGAAAARCTVSGATSPFLVTPTGICGSNVSRAVNGAAANWVDVNFAGLSGGSPLTTLPVDPVNTTTYYYGYACNNTSVTYEYDAKLESVKFKTDQDLDGNDGGNGGADWYEVGNALTF